MSSRDLLAEREGYERLLRSAEWRSFADYWHEKAIDFCRMAIGEEPPRRGREVVAAEARTIRRVIDWPDERIADLTKQIEEGDDG